MSKMKNCILCGDDVEEPEHRVCYWHAICEKDIKGTPLYGVECEYALRKYIANDLYMNSVKCKKDKILEKLRIK